MQKTSILGQKGSFWTVFGQNGQNSQNYQKALGAFFSHLQALTKSLRKSNERFPRKSVAYVRTDGQTRLLRSQRLRRETKKLYRYFNKEPII